MDQFLPGLFVDDIIVIFPERTEPAFSYPFSQSGLNQFLLPVVKMDTALVINQSTDPDKIRLSKLRGFMNGMIQRRRSLGYPSSSLPINPFRLRFDYRLFFGFSTICNKLNDFIHVKSPGLSNFK